MLYALGVLIMPLKLSGFCKTLFGLQLVPRIPVEMRVRVRRSMWIGRSAKHRCQFARCGKSIGSQRMLCESI